MQFQSPSGLGAIPLLQWGSHVSQFYETGDDLRDTLVPYFKAGLENNESCLWVTGAPFGAHEARAALRSVVSDFDARESRQQIEIRDAHEWYAAGAALRPHDIVADLLRREHEALNHGYQGLRTNGNCAWVEPGQWDDFQRYEMLVQEAVRGRRMICMCSYCFDRTHSGAVHEVMERHDFALPRRGRPAVLRGQSGQGLTSGPAVAHNVAVIFEQLPAAIYTTDADGYLTYYNEAATQIWGYRPEIGRQRWCGTWKIVLADGTPVPHEECPMAVAVQTGKPIHGAEAEAVRPDGTRVPCAVYPTPLFDDDGKVIGGINLMIDLSERKAAEERHATLAREMHHRVNNTLATVQAIMGSTMRFATTMAEFQQSFASRIQALSKTHALLTKSAQPSLSLRGLLDNELGMFADGDDLRVTLSGPDVTLPERLAVPVGMAIHELATNAAKYGALAALGARLAVSWQQLDGRIEIHWQEQDVPVVRAPMRVGFGTRLLEEILPKQIGASIVIRYQPEGVDARLVIPVAGD
jgi:PAS domain S-box-containing protein